MSKSRIWVGLGCCFGATAMFLLCFGDLFFNSSCQFLEVINQTNIHKLRNCSVIDGFIEIREDLFNSTQNAANNGTNSNASMEFDYSILNNLLHIEEVTNYVLISSGAHLRHLGFLRNLKAINGKVKYQGKWSLYIANTTKLEYLNLLKLKVISTGQVYISNNTDLCHIYSISWPTISKRTAKISKNRNSTICNLEGRTCYEECDPETGCWGPGSHQCYQKRCKCKRT